MNFFRSLIVAAVLLAIALATLSTGTAVKEAVQVDDAELSSLDRAGHGDHDGMSPEPKDDDNEDDEHHNPGHGEPGHDHSMMSPEPGHEGHDGHEGHEGHDHSDPATPSPSTPAGDSTDSNANAADDDVCIDASALSHLPASHLVYAEHRRAGVLCDASGSCATPGHIVVHNGVPMMMASYCAVDGVTCSKKVTLVNSPRMGRALRVQSKTNGLEYTALAARYGSKTEEALLRTAVHLGM